MEGIVQMENPSYAAELFAGWEETLIWSCLQGVMGHVYGDHPQHPASAAAILGDFCFLAGKPSEALTTFKPESSKQDFIIMIPQSGAWGRLIESCWREKAKKTIRYAMKKNPQAFDKERLKKIVSGLQDGYEVKPIDKELFQQCKAMEWSRDQVGLYQSYEEYKKLGLGFAILKNGKVVSGASSYSSYKEGIEIQIDTEKDHRRKGLARVCGAALILECLKRGIYPSWDAQNPESAALAGQLGYQLDHSYTAYDICGYERCLYHVSGYGKLNLVIGE